MTRPSRPWQLALETAVRALPTSGAGELALWLLLHDSTGERSDPCGCPLARFLSRYLGEAVVVSVSPVSITAWRQGVGPGRFRASVDTPAVVSQFVLGFDAGRWPELDSAPRGAVL